MSDSGNSRTAALRTAVVGVGYFGRVHAEKYATAAGAELVAVVDVDQRRGAEVGEALGVPALSDFRDLAGAVDAVSVATPTTRHYPIVRTLLDHGIAVLVEKPIAGLLADADDLVRRAETNGVVLQVGHQERFLLRRFPLGELMPRPTRVLCRRRGPFTGRNLDCGIVVETMIHDIDLVRNMILPEGEFVEMRGSTRTAASPYADEADAVLIHEGGCRVELSASRIAPTRERSLVLEGEGAIVDFDFVNRVCRHSRLGEIPALPVSEAPELADDPVGEEIRAFLRCVRDGTAPLVTGADARRALHTALRLTDALEEVADRNQVYV